MDLGKVGVVKFNCGGANSMGAWCDNTCLKGGVDVKWEREGTAYFALQVKENNATTCGLRINSEAECRAAYAEAERNQLFDEYADNMTDWSLTKYETHMCQEFAPGCWFRWVDDGAKLVAIGIDFVGESSNGSCGTTWDTTVKMEVATGDGSASPIFRVPVSMRPADRAEGGAVLHCTGADGQPCTTVEDLAGAVSWGTPELPVLTPHWIATVGGPWGQKQVTATLVNEGLEVVDFVYNPECVNRRFPARVDLHDTMRMGYAETDEETLVILSLERALDSVDSSVKDTYTCYFVLDDAALDEV
jgi:hypothetical protein